MVDQNSLLLSQLINNIGQQNNLENGSYRLTFYADNDMSIRFSIVLENKERLNLINNKLVSINKYNVATVGFDFDIELFYYCNFGVTFTDYMTLAPQEKLKLMTEALNRVYLSIAKIPINLL